MSDSNDDMGPLGWILMIGFVGLILWGLSSAQSECEAKGGVMVKSAIGYTCVKAEKLDK